MDRMHRMKDARTCEPCLEFERRRRGSVEIAFVLALAMIGSGHI
jgi:predicted nucleic acid-binding Zn ribbon protein